MSEACPVLMNDLEQAEMSKGKGKCGLLCMILLGALVLAALWVFYKWVANRSRAPTTAYASTSYRTPYSNTPYSNSLQKSLQSTLSTPTGYEGAIVSRSAQRSAIETSPSPPSLPPCSGTLTFDLQTSSWNGSSPAGYVTFPLVVSTFPLGPACVRPTGDSSGNVAVIQPGVYSLEVRVGSGMTPAGGQLQLLQRQGQTTKTLGFVGYIPETGASLSASAQFTQGDLFAAQLLLPYTQNTGGNASGSLSVSLLSV